MEPVEKTRQGLGFLTGFIGAFIIPYLFMNAGVSLSVSDFFTPTNAGYIINAISGIFVGALTVMVSKGNQLRILLFVVGTWLVIDLIVFFSTNASLSHFINRMIVDFSLLTGGLATYLIHKINSRNKTSVED